MNVKKIGYDVTGLLHLTWDAVGWWKIVES